MKIALKLLVMPEPCKKKKGDDIMAKARQWVEDCESFREDAHAWNMLRMLFNKLVALKKRTAAQEALFELIEPTIEKYASHDCRGVDLRPEHLTVVRGANPVEGANE